MQIIQQLNELKIARRASFRERVAAGLIFLAVAVPFGLLRLAADNKIDIGSLIGPCGFRQKYNLPCPTCGMTTSALFFVQGRIFESFYIQPAGGFLCSIAAVIALLAFFMAVSGIYFIFFSRFFAGLEIKYVLLILAIIIAAGWAVTLSRELASR